MTSGDHQRKERELNLKPTLRPIEGGAAGEQTESSPGITKLLFAFTKRHHGKALELDASHETMRVLGPQGEELAVVNSEVALDQILGGERETRAPAHPEENRPAADLASRPRPMRISARGSDGRSYEGVALFLGPTDFFLELAAVPGPGTQLDMTIVSAEDGSRLFRSKGTVAWICPHPDEFGFGPGVGMTWTRPAPELSAFLSEPDRSRDPRSSKAR